jgi:integrase
MKGLYAKQNGYWYFQPSSPRGEPRPKAIALGTRDELDAITLARRQADRHAVVVAVTAGTLREILPRYCEAKDEDAKKTQQVRKQVLGSFAELMGNPRLADIDGKMLKEWRRKLRQTGGGLATDKPVSPSTLTSYLIVLKAMLNWAVEQGLIRSNPVRELGKGHTTVRVTRSQRFIERDKRDELLAEPCRDYIGLILHLGFFAGLRDGEMLACNPDWIWIADDGKSGSLTVQDTKIKLIDGSVSWWRAKGKRARVIPLDPRLIAFLKNYGKRRPFFIAPDKPQWPTGNTKRFDAKMALKNHGIKCGVPDLAFHILRHSFGTHLSMAGLQMNQIAALLGDTLGVTERHYIGFSQAKASSLKGL